MAEPTKKKDHRYYAFWRLVTAVLVGYIAWTVSEPDYTSWDDDAWWPLPAVIAVLYGLAGVRSLALHVRERQADDEAGAGTT